MHTPTDEHLQALKWVLRYLNGTLSHGLFISTQSSSSLVAFSDADWVGCPDDRKSIVGYLIYLSKNLFA